MNKNKGERSINKKIKRPKFIIFTDKDGTLNLDNKNLNNILRLVKLTEGMVIPITGRTVGDIEEDFRKRAFGVPKLIIGDNGAIVKYTPTGEFLIKKTLPIVESRNVIKEFINLGGDIDLIRYTDGDKIYASPEDSVKTYYAKSSKVEYDEDIRNRIEKGDLTKITLAGTKEQMCKVAEFANENGFWTDMDKTRFPKKENGNYRLDIAPKDISKGETVKAISRILKPEFRIYVYRKWL